MSKHFIRTQKTTEKKGSEESYGKWCQSHSTRRRKGSLGNRFDMVVEHVQANPDSLLENESIYFDSQPSTPQFLMGEAIEHLQGRQRECYILTMREGKSFSEAAEILGVGKGRVQQYRKRAIKFISAYCKAAMKNGRV